MSAKARFKATKAKAAKALSVVAAAVVAGGRSEKQQLKSKWLADAAAPAPSGRGGGSRAGIDGAATPAPINPVDLHADENDEDKGDGGDDAGDTSDDALDIDENEWEAMVRVGTEPTCCNCWDHDDWH